VASSFFVLAPIVHCPLSIIHYPLSILFLGAPKYYVVTTYDTILPVSDKGSFCGQISQYSKRYLYVEFVTHIHSRKREVKASKRRVLRLF